VLADLARLFPALRLWASPSPVADGSTVAQEQPSDSSGWQHPRFSESVTGQQSTTIGGMVTACGLERRFVKIDVEGAEHSVLQGIQETVESSTPP
jgi:FkbM family methyltransferase